MPARMGGQLPGQHAPAQIELRDRVLPDVKIPETVPQSIQLLVANGVEQFVGRPGEAIGDARAAGPGGGHRIRVAQKNPPI